LEHFKSGLFGFTGDLFYTFCTLSHPTYGNQTGPNRRAQNRFKHSGEIVSRKFDDVLLALMAMAKDFIRQKTPTSPQSIKG
jgi:hypothetical protein